ncbi:uncharacterized protein IL334_002292 [Kwoniella shivajii]|uniref:PH domain-containing protein n=1 Tax=Kwoniella shivajii TaxID=564305 RepID=A0ABZ1CUB6_9TREE|nr:hypothetical protein IL334_002292 [Kwoniella shivajii]
MPRPRAPPGGLGIEDELSFGSDEDLLAEVGEIRLPNIIPSSSSSFVPLNASHVGFVKEKEKTKGGMFKSLGGGGGNKKEKKRKRTATEETVRMLSPSIPALVTQPIQSSSSSSSSAKKDKSNRMLSKSSLMIDPALESVLDVSNIRSSSTNIASGIGSRSRESFSAPSLQSITSSPRKDDVSLNAVGGKKKGFMSSLRGLGKNSGKKEDPISVFGGNAIASRPALANFKSRDSFGGRSDISRQDSFDINSSTYSSPRTESTDHSMQKHTLGPISMSPFQAQPPELTSESTLRSSYSASSKRPSISSFARRASVITSTSLATSEQTGEDSPLISKSIFSKFANVEQPPIHEISITSNEELTRPNIVTRSTTSSLAIPNSPMISSDIVSVLLPTFPASLTALSSIQILQATVIRRTFTNPQTNGGMPDREKSSSIRSLTNALSSNTHNYHSIRKPMWITQQLVLTSFKVGGSSPQSTPDPSQTHSPGSSSKTIAHLHLFSVPGSSNKSPAKPIGLGIGSSQSFGRRPSLPSGAMGDETELERKNIKSDSTAGVWNGDESGRKFVMRVGFSSDAHAEEEGEWIVEMRNADQLQEWIRQIKSIAIVIRAEREGHGHAIRNAYSESVRGDELALQLDMQITSASSMRSPTSRSGSVSGPSVTSGGPRDSTISDRPIRESPMERNPSAARAESPDMLPPTPQVEDFDERLGRLNLNDNDSVSRSKSLSRGFNYSSQDHTPISTPPSSRPGSGIPTSGGAAISRIGGSLHRHAKQGSWSSSASGGSGFVRRYPNGNGQLPPPPPPPMNPPPSVPLPALPGGFDISTTPRSKDDIVLRSPGGVEFVTPFQSPSIEEPRLSLPSPDDDNLLQIRQGTRAISLPEPTATSASTAARMKRERFMNAFKPIQLVPEVETSPRLGGLNETPVPGLGSGSTNSSPMFNSSSPHLGIRPPTPPRKSTITTSATPMPYIPALGTPLSTKEQHEMSISSSEIDHETLSETTGGFYTPIETPTSAFPMPPSQGAETIESNLSTPSTMSELNTRPETKRYASSISSVPSVESRSTTASGRRRREKKVAVDIMSEFSENPDAAYADDDGEQIKEDRPRVIRFA